MPSEGTSTPPQFELVKVVNQPPVGACALPNTLVKCSTGDGAGLYQCVDGQWTQLGPFVNQATVTLTSAQLLAMTDVGVGAITLVPAQAGKVILPLIQTIIFNPVTTPYTDNGSSFGFAYEGEEANQPGLSGQITGYGMTGDVAAFAGLVGQWGVVPSQPSSEISGLPLVFDMLQNSGGPMTDGDGTLTVAVYYLVVPA